MTDERRHQVLQQRSDEERKEVTSVAAQYHLQVPGITWGEAIRLAEKHVAGRSH